jgi:hypoxanthine phosphoribosyltransferase
LIDPDLSQRYPEMTADLQDVLLTPAQIQLRVQELSARIAHDYTGRNPLLVGVLKGVIFFMADLLRALPMSVEVDFLAVASYSPEARNRGKVRLVKDLDTDIGGRHVLFVEDVIDTGLTLNYLLSTLRARQPASLEVCVLFDKPEKRLIDIPLKYKGFNLPDQFVVGYGLDYHERYRNLPFVGLLKAQVLK